MEVSFPQGPHNTLFFPPPDSAVPLLILYFEFSLHLFLSTVDLTSLVLNRLSKALHNPRGQFPLYPFPLWLRQGFASCGAAGRPEIMLALIPSTFCVFLPCRKTVRVLFPLSKAICPFPRLSDSFSRSQLDIPIFFPADFLQAKHSPLYFGGRFPTSWPRKVISWLPGYKGFRSFPPSRAFLTALYYFPPHVERLLLDSFPDGRLRFLFVRSPPF